MARAYYNEIEPAAAHVIECLIRDGVIAAGDVDRRSIVDVEPGDVRDYTQAHFFAGGGLWSVAARLAGWPDDRPLWTGSCPCQPFSVAGKGKGTADARHLWPDFFRLIRSCRPSVVVGEQVAGAAGYGWFDGVYADLEGEDYASRAVDIPACAVNAPHIRQRLYWVAVADAERDGTGHFAGAIADEGRRAVEAGAESLRRLDGARLSGGTDARDTSDVADADSELRDGCGDIGPRGRDEHSDRSRSSDVADTDERESRERYGANVFGRWEGNSEQARVGGGNISGRNGSFWSDAEWRRGADGKERRVKSGVRLLVDGLPGRVGLLRIGGNAIVPPLAAQVIAAVMETL